MRYDLSQPERRVLLCFQEEGTALLDSQIASILGLERRKVLETMELLADKELIRFEDCAGELSPLGESYNLLNDESLDAVLDQAGPVTQSILQCFLADPECSLSYKELELKYDLASWQIDEAIEECQLLGYPVRSRISP
ncbi:MAG: hypothetical protein A4E36_00236 [Methanoregulaceae archaeon PtaB.Bin009]|nr:MAG: hypothetical protein A4E36_00236 [Methanoregulaceae archaeon PtaB.Bin009]OPY42986.1 MAG: hypothetical protein A4E41_00023 [Methanoregulaceae archaeon PtaU1.Bin066]